MFISSDIFQSVHDWILLRGFYYERFPPFQIAFLRKGKEKKKKKYRRNSRR